jgi:peptide deformylase
MIYSIVRYGDPVLREKGKKIASITEEIRQLVKDMLETMNAADGVGLAAQQIGKALQLAVVDVTPVTNRESRMWIKDEAVNPLDYMPLILLNPVITLTKKKVIGYEGCLSFPGIGADISRSTRIQVKTQTLDGNTLEFEAGGLLGRAIQHEYDHLQGKLFIDHLDAATRKEMKDDLELILQGKEVPDRSE